jgi:DNA-binding transcriptional LysR family regulator
VHLDLRQLEFFVAVAGELSFTRAAERLHVAQPWLSAEVRKLEAGLGYSLFDRSTRHVALTAEGRDLLPHARAVLERVAAYEVAAQALLRGRGGRLRIGAPTTGSHLPERYLLVDRFMERYPHVRVEIENDRSVRLPGQALRGDVDVAFVWAPFPSEGLEARLVRRTVYSVLLPVEHEAANRSVITLQDLRHKRVAAFARELNPGLFDQIYGPLLAIGVELVEAPEASESMLLALADRQRLAVLQVDWGSPSGFPARLVERPIEGHPITSEFYAVRHAGQHTALCDAFWAILPTDADQAGAAIAASARA